MSRPYAAYEQAFSYRLPFSCVDPAQGQGTVLTKGLTEFRVCPLSLLQNVLDGSEPTLRMLQSHEVWALSQPRYVQVSEV